MEIVSVKEVLSNRKIMPTEWQRQHDLRYLICRFKRCSLIVIYLENINWTQWNVRTKVELPFRMNNGECLAHDFIELMEQKNVSFSPSNSNANFDYDTL